MISERPSLDLSATRGALRQELDRDEKAQLWGRIDAKIPLHGDAFAERGQEPLGRAPAWPWKGLAWEWMAGCALVVLGIWLSHTWLEGRVNGPLTLDSGRALETVRSSDERQTLVFADESRVELAPKSQIDPLAMTEDQVVLRLVDGSARFAIKKGGPRRWRIEAGVLSVEVVGTQFEVQRSAQRVRVVVTEGRVLVRSSALTDGVMRLDAGQDIVVENPAAAPAARSDTAPRAPTAPATAAEPTTDPVTTQARAETTKRASITLATLQAQVDQARRDADPARTASLLKDIIRLYPSDPAAALSSFSLGRIHQRQGQWASADRAYQWALDHGASGPLREDCYLRRVEVELKLAPAQAQSTARTYFALYPSGRHRAVMEKMLAAAPSPLDPSE